MTGGHFYWCNQEADGIDGVRNAVRQLVKEGVDHIKIMASGGGTAGTDNRRPYYSVEELRAIVDEAHNLGKRATAHCMATKSISNALDAGVDMIEHAGFIEPDGSLKFYPEIAERIAQDGVYLSPTIPDHLPYLRGGAGETPPGNPQARRQALRVYPRWNEGNVGEAGRIPGPNVERVGYPRGVRYPTPYKCSETTASASS